MNKKSNGVHIVLIQNIYELFALDGKDFVVNAYMNLLERVPDEHGLLYYLGRMALGDSKQDVILELTKSPEYRPKNQILGLEKLIINEKRTWTKIWGNVLRQKQQEKITRSTMYSLAKQVSVVAQSVQESSESITKILENILVLMNNSFAAEIGQLNNKSNYEDKIISDVNDEENLT